MKKTAHALIALSLFWLVTVGPMQQPVQAQESATEYSTPPGITLVDVMRLNVEWLYEYTRIGDAEGRTLYIFDNDRHAGESACYAACAELFPPVIALPGSVSGGDWSLVKRRNGSLQWAYRNKPLYSFSKETRPHEVIDNMTKKYAFILSQEGKNGEVERLVPPEGWHIAKFEPGGNLTLPTAVKISTLAEVSQHALVTANGITLYTPGESPSLPDSHCDKHCVEKWSPLYAAELANPLGAFAPVTLANGRRQWSYRGERLFTWSGDTAPGDVNGLAAGAPWRVATVARHYVPPSVELRRNATFGKILSTTGGMPLYTRSPFDYQRFYKRYMVYPKGKMLGTRGCDVECLKTWRPFIASKDAVSRGYWEIVERDDGSRQWAYKGFVLYTYANDEPYKVVTGNNIYDYVVGDGGRYTVADATVYRRGWNTAPALFWLVTLP